MLPANNAKQNELEKAFEKFEQAGSRLETKYRELLAETEVLRGELAAKEIEIRRSERLALMGETAAALAHEVRNPLGAIRLFLSLLRDEVNDKPAALDLLKKIDKSVMALDNVVSNILQFSRTREMNHAPLNLHSVILEQVSAVQALPGFACSIETRLNSAPFINGNEHGLRQAVYNLLLNACQATKYTGRIIIETADEATGVRMRVADNGPGVDGRHAERIFDPFFTTRNEGTGLGLAVVKQIISQHGGSISARNEGGAVFEVSLKRNPRPGSN